MYSVQSTQELRVLLQAMFRERIASGVCARLSVRSTTSAWEGREGRGSRTANRARPRPRGRRTEGKKGGEGWVAGADYLLAAAGGCSCRCYCCRCWCCWCCFYCCPTQEESASAEWLRRACDCVRRARANGRRPRHDGIAGAATQARGGGGGLVGPARAALPPRVGECP